MCFTIVGVEQSETEIHISLDEKVNIELSKDAILAVLRSAD